MRAFMLKRFIYIVAFIIPVLLILSIWQGYEKGKEIKRQEQALRAEIIKLRAEKEALRQKAQSLKEDPYTIEKEARTTLGMVREEDDVVYILREEGR